MEQFSLEKYLENPSRKVVTRDGRPVRIICTDSPNVVVPIVGFVEGEIQVRTWEVNGVSNNPNCVYDLFFADEEEELTEFEKEVDAIVDENIKRTIGIKYEARYLLDLARKELENNDWRQSLRSYKDAYEQGKKDALKDLPKWKKVKSSSVYPTVIDCLNNPRLCYREYEISIHSLIETLPKEE